MNEAQMKMFIPPSLGILAAALASGICFLLLGSFRKGKGGKSVDDSRCACCLKPFLVGRGVECNDCGSRSCRKACCRWDSIDNSWFCLFCYHSRSCSRKKEKWFETFGGLSVEAETRQKFSTAKSQVYDEGAEDVAIHSELDLAAGGCEEGDSVETVREFVEKIVSGLVGNVDDTPIDRLYDHPAYKPATDTPTMAHTALRELVERAVDEARRLPGLGTTVSTGIQEDSSFSEQNYEDLLATAILNKVIEKFQNERVDGNSNVLHGIPRSKNANHENETIGLDEGVDECSSLEPLSQDECSSDGSGSRSRRIRSRQEPVSLKIEQQIEEVTTTTYASDEQVGCADDNVLDFRNARRVPFPEFGMDIIDPSQDSSDESEEESSQRSHVDLITPVETWEENWLFQKRKIQTSSEPVSMLVPNPSADFRALIGDKDAEDTSDLSEFSAQSDDDDETNEAINEVVRKSSRLSKAKEDFSQELREKDQIDPSLRSISKIERHTRSNEIASDLPSCVIKNSEIPKTPATSPVGNPLPDAASKALAGCEIRHLEEKLVSIDRMLDKQMETGDASLVTRDTKMRKDDKRDEEIFLSSSAVNQCLGMSTTNGCPKIVLSANDDDRHEDDNIGRRIGRRIVKNAPQEPHQTNEVDERKIENGVSIILEGSSSGETEDRQCEALARAKADSASEKPSPRNPVDDTIELATPPRPGTIAEREHKKWENAAPIENNPYSEENIHKRLLERQYARRSSSDVSGSSTKLQTSPSPPVQIIFGGSRPDFKRFGRDYYINEAKFPKGHSSNGDNGFHTASSRPNSSLSRHSLSPTIDYYEQQQQQQQELSRSVDTESTCSTLSEPKTETSAELRNNNVEQAMLLLLRRSSMPVDNVYETNEIPRHLRNDERHQSLNDVSRGKVWNHEESNDDNLERERKNSKNEINARLNNRENFGDDAKPIRRIDLRAYGFENEFNVQNAGGIGKSTRPKTVVNKLDLSSFGYDSGLRRTQSNSNIDRRANVVVKSRFNQTNGNRRFSELPCPTKSTEILNEVERIDSEKLGRITAAKSVPNIADLYTGVGDRRLDIERDDAAEEDAHRERSNSMEEESPDRSDRNLQVRPKVNGRPEIRVTKASPMPSVRRLARAFDKTKATDASPVRRTSKSVNQPSRERPTTPEIHIVDSPRQMHSLTARSLSREFREGLRQIGNKKQAAPPRVEVPSEQNRLSEIPSPATNVLGSSSGGDEVVGVIAPGQLKNNIKFWEQLNRKS